ncbi:MAG: S1 RNA-binding domain-containing protein [Actinobacteria bacterium]|nr:S1 RNA-binding domain-containing protein [Actinomycetota bacterium]
MKQLNDAVLAFMKEYPKTQITVVVDASFGHRIDKKEAAEFSEAIANGELVTPPAGAVGRGDGFVLMIADKVNATVLSNDSYQEFHDQYTWLFDMGRLLGGKPVPHVGWVFVDRLPVRAKTDSVARRGVPNKTAPIPRPTRPPQRAVPKPDTAPKPEVAPSAVNSAEQYDAFAAKQPVGAKVKGTVESFASHGVYVRIGDVAGYLPLRLMKSPPPRTPREHVKIGESLVLTVSGFNPARRSIEVSLLPVEKLATKAPRGAKTARPARQPRPGGDGSRQAKSRGLRRRRRPD